jgi:hypothetical protein
MLRLHPGRHHVPITHHIAIWSRLTREITISFNP